ncbi:MAG: twin-arginine translocase subunit TatC [Muribaculaceae bacterium]|nr:twin-arginine translocase subunit TatC [Muribaculaceae bacterium]
MKNSKENLVEMSFWDHIAVLRNVLLKIALVVIVIMTAFFIYMKDIFDNVILAPCRADFILYRFFHYITTLSSALPDFDITSFHVNLINIQLASQFFIHMSTSFWLGIIFSFPIIIYLLWGFIKPALYSKERRGVTRAFIVGNFMFFLGIAVGYFVVFPVTLRFLAEYQVSEMVPNQISLDSYMDNFLVMIFIMGIIFEMPLLAWALSIVGVLRRSFFSRFRRHAFAALLILAAIITPTGDPFTLMIVFLPLYGLFELSAFFVAKDKPEVEDDDVEENGTQTI